MASHIRKITDVRGAIFSELCYAPAFASELSQLLRVRRELVRYHLDKLVADGEVISRAFCDPMHTGRPAKLYMIKAHAPKGRD